MGTERHPSVEWAGFLGRDLDPAASPRLLVVLAQLAFGPCVEVGREGAASPAGSVSLPLVGGTAEVGVHFTTNEDAHLMQVPTSALDLGSDAVLSASDIGRHAGHFFFVP